MKKYLTPHDIANTIQMARLTDPRSFLIVEGNTDVRFYKKLVDSEECEIIPAITKINALRTREILLKNNVERIIVIIDADFSEIEGTRKPASLNFDLLLTDTHDLETMILQSEALEAIITEYCDRNNLAKVCDDVRKFLLERGKIIGYLRWVNHKDRVLLKFGGLNFDKFVNKKTLKIDENRLISEILNNTRSPNISHRDLKIRLKKIMNKNHNLWHVCNGHDLINILLIGFKKKFGLYNVKDLDSNTLSGLLRVAYHPSFFCKTRLYGFIREWERLNVSFKVLIDGICS